MIEKLPGLIDVHVHLRFLDPHKEDFLTSTFAGIAGGFTTVLDMPNNNPPITNLSILKKKMREAQKYGRYNIGFYFGSLGDNLDEFDKVKNLVFGLKLYLNQTTGGYIIDELNLQRIYKKWNEVTKGKRPILLHAESDVLSWVEKILRKIKQPTHICHVSSKSELSKIIKLKKEGFPITCGVTPHHLFLTSKEGKKLGPYGLMKPVLKTQKDIDYLWKNMKYIDVIESDHAPHTKDEKEGKNPPFGVPGLESTLPLLLTAFNKKRIQLSEIIRLCHDNPIKIFNIPKIDSYTYIDLKEKYVLRNEDLFTKCKWSPFNGFKMQGKIKKVVLNGKTAYNNGVMKTQVGSGKILKPKLI